MTANLFAACKYGDDLVAKRVRLNEHVQNQVEELFLSQELAFRKGVFTERAFDGRWKPDADEVLTIEMPAEALIFTESIRATPANVEEMNVDNFPDEPVKGLFIGVNGQGQLRVLVQRFTSGQILSKKFALFSNGNRFNRLTMSSFSLDTSLTCVMEDGSIKFKSQQKLRSFIDMTETYREATDDEVRDFVSHDSFYVRDPESFLEVSDQVTRKLVQAIVTDGVLDRFPPSEIVEAARTTRLQIELQDGKVVIPESRSELKELLQLLDETRYAGPLSGRPYVSTNSRPA